MKRSPEMPKIILQANTPAELRCGLAGLDTHVPARSDGRRSHHAERYCIAHFLATLPIERLSFPLNLTHSDKPDFLLTTPDGDVGIEHTEAVPENAARAEILRDKGLGPDVYFTPHFVPGEPRKTTAELRRELEENAPGKAWGGDSPLRKWATAMAYCIEKKLPKAMADGFTRHPTNWLIVYDNWPPRVLYDKAVSYLAPLLVEMNAFSVFNAIFVYDDSQMCEFGESPIIHTRVRPGID